jgi:hypothetical protein
MWREMRLGAERFWRLLRGLPDRWRWFRGLPTWGQVVGWIVVGFFALVVLGAIIGEEPAKEGEKQTAAKQADQAPSSTETKSTETTPSTETKPKPEPKKDVPVTQPPPKPKPKGDPAVDKNTRYFLNQMSYCELSVGLVLADIRRGKLDDIELADGTTQARNVCDDVRGKLLLADTDHFDDEAALGFDGIDRFKSGLNAMLAYIDNPRPTKVVEARDKLQEGDQATSQARREINQRRRVYGLKPYHP